MTMDMAAGRVRGAIIASTYAYGAAGIVLGIAWLVFRPNMYYWAVVALVMGPIWILLGYLLQKWWPARPADNSN
jgi:hypothetical protein